MGTAAGGNDDHVIAEPPNDAISRLRFSPNGQFLCSGSWANDLRVWQVATQVQSAGGFSSSSNKIKIDTQAKAVQNQEGPVLDVCWNLDGSKIFSAGADKKAMMWDLGSNQFTQVGAHEQPIMACGYAKGPNYECLVTGSLDKTLKLWDLRQPNPIMTFNCPERIYCLDIMGPAMVVATADRKILAYQMHPEPKEWKPFDSQLKQQTRCIRLFKNKEGTEPSGCAYGSIEGRTALLNFNPSNPTKDNFTTPLSVTELKSKQVKLKTSTPSMESPFIPSSTQSWPQSALMESTCSGTRRIEQNFLRLKQTSKTTLASRLLHAMSMPTGQSLPMRLGTIGIGATRQTIQMSSQRLYCAM